MKSLLSELKAFLLRGNLVDLAVAVVMGVAFGALVNALVKDIFTPLIAAIFGSHDFSNLRFTVHGSRFLYGDFVNAVITFLSVATALFFFVVKPTNVLLARYAEETPPDSTLKKCPECLSDVPAAARRCKFCTSELD
jgi:large conductance mechanosensitive channel